MEEVASPCTKICTLDPARTHCLGCFRTLSEIATWSTLPPAAKRAVVAACTARQAAFPIPPAPGV